MISNNHEYNMCEHNRKRPGFEAKQNCKRKVDFDDCHDLIWSLGAIKRERFFIVLLDCH